METEEILWIAAKAWGTQTLWNLDQLIHSFLTKKRDNFDIQGIPIDKKIKYPATESQNGFIHSLNGGFGLAESERIAGQLVEAVLIGSGVKRG